MIRGTRAGAFDTGHASVAVSAAFRNDDSSMPGAAAPHRQGDYPLARLEVTVA